MTAINKFKWSTASHEEGDVSHLIDEAKKVPQNNTTIKKII
jgi:hypothetical protein